MRAGCVLRSSSRPHLRFDRGQMLFVLPQLTLYSAPFALRRCLLILSVVTGGQVGILAEFMTSIDFSGAQAGEGSNRSQRGIGHQSVLHFS